MANRHPRHFVAVIGDMVHSRELSPDDRAAAQRDFSHLVTLLNRKFASDVAAKFVVTLGDEFQGLLSSPEAIPEIVWLVETYRQREIRLGFGAGTLHTPLQPVALNIDGPVLHHARAAITFARRHKLLGGVFYGFGTHDPVLTGFAQILRHARQRMTERQKTVVGGLRAGKNQLQVAKKLDISKQAVSNHAIAAGWEPYRLAEVGWKQALDLAWTSARAV